MVSFATGRHHTQQTAFSVQFVPGMRFLVCLISRCTSSLSVRWRSPVLRERAVRQAELAPTRKPSSSLVAGDAPLCAIGLRAGCQCSGLTECARVWCQRAGC
eukprot:3360174-Rhodomonas_salina.1